MISALIHVVRPGDPESIDRLADTLSALVAGVAAGLISDALIIASSSNPALETVAEATGAKFVLRPRRATAWAAGAKAARRDWVLCLEAGDVPTEGWIRILDRFVGTARPEVGFARLRRPHAGLPARLAAGSESVIGVARPRAGDLVRRERLLSGPTFGRRLKVRRLIARLERA